MITLPVVLIAAAVLLLLALLLGLFLQRRRSAGAAPPGPRTVADLVRQRADRDPEPAPAEPAVEEPAPTDAVGSTVDEPAAADAADPEPPDVDEPPVPVPGPVPVTAARTIAPLGDDVPWRRAARMSGTADAEPDLAPEPEPSDLRRVPALALLRRPSRRPPPADTRHPFLSSAPRLTAVPATPSADLAEVAAPVPVVPTRPEPPVDGPVGGDPAGREQAEDERTQDVPSGAVLPLGGSGPAAEPDGVAGEATGALVSTDPDRASDQDGPPAPMTDTVDQADDVHEPVEAQVAPAHTGTGPAAAPAAFAGAAALALTLDAPHPEPDDFPSTDPDVLFDSPPEAPAVEPAPSPDDVAAAAPAAVPPLMSATETPAHEASATAAAPSAQAEPPGSTTAPPPAAPATARPGATEPTRRTPRDPVHLAAEQAAADLALLRTFGDPAARPERAPIVALEGTTRPESPRPLGSAQPVRFRAVRRDGTEVAGAGVVLLDDRGHEVGTGRSAAGELTAPHPGAYVLVATAPDHQPGAVALAVGDAPVDADVLLARSAALVGVVSGEDGPLTGARVTLVQDGEVVDVAETDADGAYLVADLASGEYAVSVAAAGCDADVVLVVVADEAECVHDVELDPAGVPAG